MTKYEAPWSTSLVLISALVTIACVGIAAVLLMGARGGAQWVGLVPLAAVGAGALFTIRGYTVTSDAILVHRLFWATRLPLADLRSARFEPNAMRGSLRTLGNGGLFSFTGFFRNRTLGSYRAFVTNPRRTVVLGYPRRAVVVSPARPEEFIQDLPDAHRGA